MTDTLKTAREDLLEAHKAFVEAKARGAELRTRQREAQAAVAEADKRLTDAKIASDKAFEAHVAGDLSQSEFNKRFAEVEKCEADLRAAKHLAQRWQRVNDQGRALQKLRGELGDAMEIFATAAIMTEIGVEDLRARLLRSFVLFRWSGGNPVEELGSERGSVFHDFLTAFFDPCTRDEVAAASAHVEKYFADLPEDLR